MIGRFIENKIKKYYNLYTHLSPTYQELEYKKYNDLYWKWREKRNKYESFKTTLIIFSTLIAMIVSLIFGIYKVKEKSCYNFQQETKLETKFDFWSYCYVNYKDQWIPTSNFIIYGDK